MSMKALAFLALTCIGVSSHAQIDTTAAGTKPAGLYETSECRFPKALTIARENMFISGWSFPFVNRYVQFAGEPAFRMTGPNITVTGKNPERVSYHGAEHYTNCTNGNPQSQYQTITFKLRTSGYFDTGVGNHIAVLLRSSFTSMDNDNLKNYEGVGAAIFHDMGIFGERFNLRQTGFLENSPLPFPQFKFNDNQTYEIIVHAAPTGSAFAATNLSNGARVPNADLHFFPGVNNTNPPIYFQGAGIAVLCSDENGACTDTGAPFRVDIWDIAVGWFTP